MSFGEMAMLGKAARSADVHAVTAVRSWTLSARSLDELAVDHPEIKIAVLRNLSLDLAQNAAGQAAHRRPGGIACNPFGPLATRRR